MTDWCVLVPQKALARAKGRLDVDPRTRRAMALAMLTDTLDAVAATPGVTRVVVLWDDSADATTLQVESLGTEGRPLNPALELGAAQARHLDPAVSLAVVPGDLPALDPAELHACLEIASSHGRAFLPDAEGTGSTVLTATSEADLAPRYGLSSTLAHAVSGAHLICPDGLISARTDVDDLASLARALELGCGDHTRAACAAAGLLPELVP